MIFESKSEILNSRKGFLIQKIDLDNIIYKLILTLIPNNEIYL